MTYPPAAIEALVEIAGPGSALTMLQLRHMGGALARTSRAPERGRRSPVQVCMFGLGVVPGPDAAPAVTLQLEAPVDRRCRSPRRRLPELHREAGQRERLLRRRHLDATAAGEGALRPAGPVQGQSPHPAGRTGLTHRRVSEVSSERPAPAGLSRMPSEGLEMTRGKARPDQCSIPSVQRGPPQDLPAVRARRVSSRCRVARAHTRRRARLPVPGRGGRACRARARRAS